MTKALLSRLTRHLVVMFMLGLMPCLAHNATLTSVHSPQGTHKRYLWRHIGK